MSLLRKSTAVSAQVAIMHSNLSTSNWFSLPSVGAELLPALSMVSCFEIFRQVNDVGHALLWKDVLYNFSSLDSL